MENLQTASTVVDASARIYSFRVDAVHYDVLKMAGGLSKAAQVRFLLSIATRHTMSLFPSFFVGCLWTTHFVDFYLAILGTGELWHVF